MYIFKYISRKFFWGIADILADVNAFKYVIFFTLSIQRIIRNIDYKKRRFVKITKNHSLRVGNVCLRE